MTTTLYSTFSVDDRYVGIPVDRVQEVLLAQPLTPVPLSHAHISGLLNLRGQIVTAIDLRRRLQLPELSSDRLPMNVVVRTEEGAVSLLVDEIGDVLEVTEESFESPPETLRGAAREFIRGTYKLPERLLLVLDTEKAVRIDVSPETV